MPDAACRGMGPDVFFPDRHGSALEAKRVCGGCVHRPECAEYAIARPELLGIWGGLSEKERRRKRRRRRLAGGMMTDMVDVAEASSNGHADLVMEGESVAVDSPSSMPEAEPELLERACVGCGQPLTGPHFKKWCSTSCRSTHRDRALENRNRREALSAPQSGAEVSGPQLLPETVIVAQGRNGAGVGHGERRDLLEALIAARFRVELVGPTGRRWELRPV